MALTPTEKQRNYRARLKEKKEALGDVSRPFLKTPFFEYFREDQESDVIEKCLDVAGFDPWQFNDNRNPASFTGEIERGGYYSDDELSSGSIGRAEIMVASLLDAASALAGIINRYKKQEIERAIADLESADLTDPATKKQALADMVRLNQIRDRLEKTIRWSLPEYQIKG